MRVYSVHFRRQASGPDLVLVKEGFCWPAFFLSFIWALWHRMWLTVLWLVAASAVLGAVSAVLRLDPVGEGAVSLGMAVLIGLFANDIRRWSLDKRGYSDEGIVVGDNEDGALRRFLARTPLFAGGLRP